MSVAIRVFEPALCCNTGVCGPDLDERLVAFTADLAYLKGRGIDIERHNLANDPGAFAASPAASAFLKVAGSAGLPLVVVGDVTVATGRYPDRVEFERLAGLIDDSTSDAAAPSLALTDLSHSTETATTGCC